VDATSGTLAEQLRSFAFEHVDTLARDHFAGWNLPRMFAGHRVGADVRADLAFTLGHLAGGGVREVAGTPIDDAVAAVLRPIDGAATHTFFSYRVAETLATHGPLEDNPLLVGWSGAERAEVVRACDSTDWIPLLGESFLPANYAAVLARCELGRRRLGLDVDGQVLSDLLERAAALFARNPTGLLDDDPDGGGRYDIYSVDLYLFCEPFAAELMHWERGLAQVLDLVGHTVGDDGTPIAWGRSTGLLGACHTIELAALAVEGEPPRSPEPQRWIRRAQVAADRLGGWFRDGVTTAHQHRSPYRYRGPARRLQLTLDALGKLAWAANRLDALETEVVASAPDEAFGADDAWVPFEERRPLGVWCYRSGHLAFSLPVTGTAWSDYLPAPRQPGRFETPVDRALAVGTPTVVVDGRTYASGGVPAAVRHAPASLTLGYDGYPELGGLEGAPTTLAGERAVTMRVERRTLHVDEHLRFEQVPDAVVLQVADAAHGPIVVEAGGAHPAVVSTVDTAGIHEWRSFWGELPRVHQIDLEPATSMSFSWSATPVLQVVTDSSHHWYLRSLYDPMAPWVIDRDMHRPAIEHPNALERLRWVDVYHLHWPEWVFDTDVEAAQRFLDLLDAAGTRLVWTQHNLLPHRDGDFADLYALFAGAAHGVIHHSEWGRSRSLAARLYRPDARHAVIPHGHWADLAGQRSAELRGRAERELDLEPCAVRIGIIGAPRPGKLTTEFIEAFRASRRDDVQLLVTSLEPDEVAAMVDDPRLRVLPYEFVDREVYNRRLAAIDVLAFPFAADTQMLTTGVFADAVGQGLPALVTGWGFLTEVLGDAGLAMGDTPESWTSAIDALDATVLSRAAEASDALRATYDWSRIASMTRTLLEDVVAGDT
jgi:glycosyltransferase involved in cell wall biosynthesis